MTYQKLAKSRNGDKLGSGPDMLGPNSEIGRKLRQYYDELVSDEIPDRFSQLLNELQQEEQQPGSAAKED
ncbi:NepR family anti-sigma factor [Chelativorans sp. AA-79]|uniref:NepR family anti-sigma factor n=1 Tax=Chelativorans sp. AA-79 TaxID=3028735 RepID=UPI0023F8B0B7|nr:NepR family anti-sigma factor [Chelativorans sp. AA-79]WEX11782.1 NepR family anti-sigma factor [Chelativorans sp. AA-79]